MPETNENLSAVSVEQALIEAHAVFSRYTELHLAKKTEDGNAKANANADMANMMAVALKAHRVSAPPPANLLLRDRFWLIVHEPGNVPVRKGSWDQRDLAKVMREFIAANPTAYLHVMTLDHFGHPEIDHGPELLQMTDGRSMSVGRKHNARTRAAHAVLAGARGVRDIAAEEGERFTTLATAVKNILPIGDASKSDSAVFPIYVRMSELRALHDLVALHSIHENLEAKA